MAKGVKKEAAPKEPKAKAPKQPKPSKHANGFDSDVVKRLVADHEDLQAQIDEIMSEAQNKCAPLREEQADVKKEAHEAGIPRQEFNSVLRERRLLAKADGVRAGLDADKQDNFDRIKHALGMLADLPLGQAALASEGDASETQH